MASVTRLLLATCPGLLIAQAMALPIPPSMRGPNGAFHGCHGDPFMWAFSVIIVMALLFCILWPYVFVIIADEARAPGPGQAPVVEQLPFGGTFRDALRRLFGFPVTVANSTGRVDPRRLAARTAVRARQRAASV